MRFFDNKPIYLQIADTICEDILQQKWDSDSRIPSVREMAASLEVNPNTVQRTYSYLQDEGIIYNKRGIGYFVAESGYETTLALKREEFISKACPEIFKSMELLNISNEEFIKLQGNSQKG